MRDEQNIQIAPAKNRNRAQSSPHIIAILFLTKIFVCWFKFADFTAPNHIVHGLSLHSSYTRAFSCKAHPITPQLAASAYSFNKLSILIIRPFHPNLSTFGFYLKTVKIDTQAQKVKVCVFILQPTYYIIFLPKPKAEIKTLKRLSSHFASPPIISLFIFP